MRARVNVGFHPEHRRFRPRRAIAVLPRLVAASLVVGLATFSVTLLPAQVAGAATDTVTNCSGSATVTGSLPYEVQNASSGETISFALPHSCSTITTASTISINTSLTIHGPGVSKLAVSGNNSVGVFALSSPGVTATISDLTIEDGSAPGFSGGGIANVGTLTVTHCTLSNNDVGSAIWNTGSATIIDSTLSDNSNPSGGGIFNAGTLSVTDSTLSGNSAPNGGGGIYNGGTATITDSTLSGNSAGGALGIGGGIENESTKNGGLIITDSTLSDNSANEEGGGIENGGTTTITDSTLSDNSSPDGGNGGGGVFNYGAGAEVTITDSTLSGNSAPGGAGFLNYVNATATVTDSTVSDNAGGGIDNNSGTMTVVDSTVSGNSGGGIDNIIGAMGVAATIVANSPSGTDCSGTTGDAGYNLDDDGSCGFLVKNDSQSGVNPDLGPLQSNGGPTDTQAPATDSPVLEQVPLGTSEGAMTLCPGTDQRGVPRPQGTECDIGAVELAVSTLKGFSSPKTFTTTAGSFCAFTVATYGTPVPSITEKGKLPKGLTFTNNGNSTATIYGTPLKKGVKHLTVTATFGSGASKYKVSQTLTLTVDAG
jgi:hypothetical protein